MKKNKEFAETVRRTELAVRVVASIIFYITVLKMLSLFV